MGAVAAHGARNADLLWHKVAWTAWHAQEDGDHPQVTLRACVGGGPAYEAGSIGALAWRELRHRGHGDAGGLLHGWQEKDAGIVVIIPAPCVGP